MARALSDPVRAEVAGIVVTNTEGRILDCNEPYMRIFGFASRDEMLAHLPGISIVTGRGAKSSSTGDESMGPGGSNARRVLVSQQSGALSPFATSR